MGETVGVAGVEVAVGRGDAVAEGFHVIWMEGSEGRGGIKLQDERKMASNTMYGFRIVRFLQARVPARFYCTLTITKGKQGIFPIDCRVSGSHRVQEEFS